MWVGPTVVRSAVRDDPGEGPEPKLCGRPRHSALKLNQLDSYSEQDPQPQGEMERPAWKPYLTEGDITEQETFEAVFTCKVYKAIRIS